MDFMWKQFPQNIVQIWTARYRSVASTCRLNHKLKNYVSFRPDPNVITVNAFSIIPWTNLYGYIFAPFCTLNMVLRKLVKDDQFGTLKVGGHN